MPKLEPKQIQKELEEGFFWPVYWIYGQERMKMRELLKRIRKSLLDGSAPTMGFGMSDERLEAGSTDGASIVDAAQSLTFGGGPRFLTIIDAHELKGADEIEALFGPRTKKADVTSVRVFLSKDLDQRKKLSKLLVEKAAVVSCEEVLEADRAAWIEYLAKQRGMPIAENQVAQLSLLDPWSLDIIDQELEKLALSKDPSGQSDASGDVLLVGGTHAGASDRFIDALLARELKPALESLEGFATEPEEALPLLGLLGWNVRQLALSLGGGSGSAARGRPNPYLADRLRRWTPKWTLDEVEALQEALSELDFASKQTARLPLALWTDIAIRFCS